ncbi:putative inner membrane protein [Actinobacillus equuli]|nr:putative inner membrane protein [Actinobacillus equuli]
MWAGPNAVIGGLLFGFGIVVAGGCETGWMYRAMEGQVHFMWWASVMSPAQPCLHIGGIVSHRYWR